MKVLRYVRSAGARQPALALYVEANLWTAYVIEKHCAEAAADLLFSELPHHCTEAQGMSEDDLAAIRKETPKLISTIADRAKSQQSQARLPFGANVLKAVEERVPQCSSYYTFIQSEVV